MEFKASVTNVRMAPRKVRKIADLIRGLDAGRAMAQLQFLPQKAVLPLSKLLKSAIANAEHNFDAEASNLFIQTIMVNGGPTYKRFMPRSQGRAFGILKRTSSINIVLAERDPKAKKRKAVTKETPEAVKISEFAKMEAAQKAEDKSEKNDKATDITKKGVKEVSAHKHADVKRSFFRRKEDA